MKTLSLKRIVFILTVIVYGVVTTTGSINSKLENTTHNCPFTRIIEDIFNINNRSSNREANWKDRRTNYLFNSTKTLSNESLSKSIEDELVNDIIASIKRIKANLTNDDNNKLNEAIILKVPKDKTNNSKVIDKKVNQIKSGIEEKIDVLKTSKPNLNEKYKMDDAKIGFATPAKPISQSVKSNYVEILTVEPNNTNISNKSTHNILEVLRNIMPALNLTKDLHSITIIERNQNKNHSFTETKNISTIIVKYCEKDNLSKNNETVTKSKHPDEEMKTIYDPVEDEYYNSDDYIDYEDQDKYLNTTSENRREVLVAAEYGIQKMNELYGVLEPKLYSMGLVLDEKDPARYVAAFNAPSEDSTTYAKYGYASLQAAAKLKELIRMLMGLPRFCSASLMFAEARTDDFYGIMRKRTASMINRLRGSSNSIQSYFMKNLIANL